MQERLQKILSARGIASRRKAEEYITAGLVKVNGIPAILGQKADPEKDQIEVSGQVLEARKEMLYFLMNKPVGAVTTNIERFLHPPTPSSRGGRGEHTNIHPSPPREERIGVEERTKTKERRNGRTY